MDETMTIVGQEKIAECPGAAEQMPYVADLPPIEQVPSIGMTKEELDARFAEVQAEQPPVQKTKKVAILGFTDSWKLAPFSDSEWEIWGLNELYLFIPRWTRWFEIHDRRIYETDRNRTHEHILRLQQMQCPIYMHQHWDDIPASVPYPLQAISQAFPNPCPEALPYLTNSITYMILLALLEGFEEIAIYGVDMAHDSEYASQRPSCEWAVGLAQGRGIKVYIPSEADLLKTVFLYGYQQMEAQSFDRKLADMERGLTEKFNVTANQLQQVIEQRAQYAGAMQNLQHLRKNWRSNHSI